VNRVTRRRRRRLRDGALGVVAALGSGASSSVEVGRKGAAAAAPSVDSRGVMIAGACRGYIR
jgi:hypothetical protein